MLYFSGQDVDEDELEAELEALEQEELDKDLLGVGTSTSELPEVPTGDIKEPAAASKEKKKGKIIWTMRNIEPNINNSQIVSVKPAEDDDDMKLLMSWAN